MSFLASPESDKLLCFVGIAIGAYFYHVGMIEQGNTVFIFFMGVLSHIMGGSPTPPPNEQPKSPKLPN
jgi:hypothetical protein